MSWMLLVLTYSLAKGAREMMKKKALEKNSALEILYLYTLLSTVLVLPEGVGALSVTPVQHGMILLKSFVIFISWILGMVAIKHMPVGLFGMVDSSKVIFSTLLGVIVVGETMTGKRVIGMLLVIAGLLMLKVRVNKKEQPELKKGSALYVILALLYCFFNAVSGVMDKICTSDGISTSHLQFWFMIDLTIMYTIYMIVTRTKVNFKSSMKNIWIYIMSVTLVVGDKLLFIANANPESMVTVMTLIKQSSILVIILGGKLFFSEKNTLHKLFCAAVVIAGIIIGFC